MNKALHQGTTEKSTTEKTKKQGENKFSAFFKGLFILSLVVLSLTCVFFDEYSPEYLAHKTTYRPTVQKRDSLNKSVIIEHNKELLKAFPNNPIAKKLANNLLNQYDSKLKEGKGYLKDYTAIKKHHANAHSFRGRSSLHFWIVVFGLSTALLVSNIKSLFDSFSRGSTFKYQFLDLAGIVVALFWLSHSIFLTQKDFTQNKYFVTLFLCSMLGSVFVYYLTKYFNYKDIAINNLTDLLVRTKEDHYEKVAVKAYYAEKNDKPIISLDTTKENIEEFDKDVEDTINKL